MKEENKKIALDSVVAREIVKEIMGFGVTQEQIMKICKFLVLELEDVAAMKDIAGKLDQYIDRIYVNSDSNSPLKEDGELIIDV